MNLQPEVKEIVRNLSNKYDLPISVVESIIDVYYEQVARAMELTDRDNCEFYPTSIPFFGKFYVKLGIQSFFKKRMLRGKEKNIQEREETDSK